MQVINCPVCKGPARIMRRPDGSADHYQWIEKKDRHSIPNPISPILADYLRAKRKGKKTVAIVGSAYSTGPWAPFGETEVWCSNETHGLPWCETDKATRWFQLHPRVFFTRPHHYKHWEWLQKEHPFPIYMQQIYDDVPNSTPYPIRGIQQNLTNIIRGEEVIRDPFSSTMCYQIALALHEKYERIEIYGVELVLDAEYTYQREAMAYWVGKADGMGVEIWMPERCALLVQPLYAYEEIRHGEGGQIIWFGGEYQGFDQTAYPDWGVNFISSNPLRIREDAQKRWGNKHKGETAIIIGNGDSLKSIPTELLNKYPSFGVNLIHMRSFQPTYFSCVGDKYLFNHAKDIYNVVADADIAFIGGQHLDKPIPELKELYSFDNIELIHRDTVTFPGEYQTMGGSATYVNLKIAYFMGFDTVMLVGCDHNPEWTHFYGNHLNTPPPEWKFHDMTYHYFVASEVYKEAGRRIINLSSPSRLDEFFERGKIGDWL